MKKFLKFRELGILITLIAALIVFSSLSEGFLSLFSFSSILSASSELGIIAVGITMLMIAGEFDLSVGVNFAFAGMIFSYLTVSTGLNCFMILSIALFSSCMIGLLNGIITVYAGIPSFITTLGTMMFWRGMLLLITSGLPISIYESNPVINLLSPNNDYSFIPGTVVWILVALVTGYVLNKTKFGNHLMATGGDKNAAFAMGINTNRVKLTCFIICGFLAGLGGVLQCCHIMSLVPQAGVGYELSTIAAAVIGGTLLTGGIGTIFGSVIGVLLINIINSGIIQAGASTYWYQSIVGGIVIIAVIINTYISRKIKTTL